MIKRALNQKTARHLSYEDFLDLAKELGCIGIEPRNDLGRPFFDGVSARLAGSMAEREACGCWGSAKSTRSTTGRTSGRMPFGCSLTQQTKAGPKQSA
ncbi:hypothetical protein Q1M62_29250 [Sinorhizobium meliloti]|nr:hypothetical protein LZK74_30500 [Sinorhizobium meliloti]WKL30937.1 hypothetical protein Q1M65_29690 [Sinorhizobium meliloti]WKL36609.1 hypothetical protein Q1M62_29250 [Sinorhizobium meliloti]